jgi:endonuclease/exonuclease/phosphatase family metal-dependent hydrolase
MPYYKGVLDALIEAGYQETARDVADRLLRLRTKLRNELPPRNVNSSILLATWNLREFGRNQKCGRRLDESLLYIAEIINHFDLVAIQEVNQDLGDLQKLIKLLGNWWEYMVTDVTSGQPGNQERIAFLYDGRKIRFDHLAGELALPPKKQPVRQPARSPFICAFRTGWRRISLCSVHIYYGTSKPNDRIRVQEIGDVAKLLAERNSKRQNVADGEPENVVLLGDFNIFHKAGDKTSDALEENDFIVPPVMRKLAGSNLGHDKYFDQIAFHDPRKRLRTRSAGVFDFTRTIFGDKESEAYTQAMERSASEQFRKAKDKSAFYKQWRTFQISDHFPLWVELKTDFADAYLATVMRGRRSAGDPAAVKRVERGE